MAHSPSAPAAPVDLRWMALFATIGLVAAVSSTWVHHQVISDPTYASFCDVSSSLSCTNAYTSRYGVVRRHLGGPARRAVSSPPYCCCSGSAPPPGRSGPTSPPTCFAAAIVGLAGVFYLGYASFVVLQTVCLLCVATYVAVLGLFVSAVAATRISMSTLPERLAADLPRLLRTPAAAAAALAFVVLPPARCWSFPAESVTAASVDDAGQAAAPATAAVPRRAAAGAREVHRRAAARAGDGGQRRRRGGARQVQRLPVPAVRPDLRRCTSRCWRSTPRSIRAS